MSKRYHVRVGDNEKGPYTKKQLQSSYNDGLLAAGTMVRKDGEEATRPLRNLIALTQPSAPAKAATADSGDYKLGIALGIFGGCIALLFTTNAKPETRRGVLNGFYISISLVIFFAVINAMK